LAQRTTASVARASDGIANPRLSCFNVFESVAGAGTGQYPN
jgi:hypothetical protein